MKKTLCVDFDGVLHSYTSGWQGPAVIADPPVDGAMAWLVEMLARYDVCIYSSRSKNPRGWWAMRQWVKRHLRAELSHPRYRASDYLALLRKGWTPDEIIDRALNAALKNLRFPVFKPAAWLTLDDRAVRFTGHFPDAAEIDGFMPWYRRGGGR